MKFGTTDYIAGAILVVGSAIWYVVKDFKKEDSKTKVEIREKKYYSGMHQNRIYVDMGVGTLWAVYNVGAHSQTDSATYYAWGDPKEKSSFCEDTYNWNSALYDDERDVDIVGRDVAHALWGGKWQLPTVDEFSRLVKACNWRKVTNYKNSGVDGYEGVSTINGNTIFFPCSGGYDCNGLFNGKDACYWTRNWSRKDDLATCFYLSDNSNKISGNSIKVKKYYGFCVRPVIGKTALEEYTVKCKREELQFSGVNLYESFTDYYSVSGTVSKWKYVDLGLPSGRKWAVNDLGSTSPYVTGSLFAWGETKAKNTYKWETYKWCEQSHGDFKKYNLNDGVKMLELADDAASAKLGKSWCLPRKSDWMELKQYCTWHYAKNFNSTGRPCYFGVSRTNGNVIVFPASKEPPTYWTSNISVGIPSAAQSFVFQKRDLFFENNSRWLGCQVRAVVRE